jgi:hypothetical protein
MTNDCGPTSLAIAANALLDREAFRGPDVAEEMSHVVFEWRPIPHLMVPRIPGWATFPWGIVHAFRKQGFGARWRLFGTAERLQRNLLANRITIVVIGEPLRWERWTYRGWAHFKILFGHTPGRGFLFVDPGYSLGGDSWSRHGLFWQEEAAFLRQWRNMLRITIEVE